MTASSLGFAAMRDAQRSANRRMVAQTAKAAMNVASNVRHAISVISNIGFLPSDLLNYIE